MNALNYTRTATPPRPRGQAGLTLIEMMTALVIGSVLLAGLTQVFVASRQGYKLSESQAYLQEAGRLTLHTITDDLRRAGYWGGNADISTLADGSTTAIVDPTALNFNTCANDSSWALMLEQRAFGLNDTAGTYACVPKSGTGGYLQGDVLVSRHADSEQLIDPQMDAQPNALFLRTNLFDGHVFVGSQQGAAANQVSTTGGPVSAYALSSTGFYVGDTGQTCESVAVPSLFRITLDATGTPQVQDLISGVEDLQVQWGLDTDGDSVPNQYLDADAIAAAQWDWPGKPQANTVVSARLWVLVRSECPDPTYDNDQTYEYGSKTGVAAYKPADHYRRQLYSTTIALRN